METWAGFGRSWGELVRTRVEESLLSYVFSSLEKCEVIALQIAYSQYFLELLTTQETVYVGYICQNLLYYKLKQKFKNIFINLCFKKNNSLSVNIKHHILWKQVHIAKQKEKAARGVHYFTKGTYHLAEERAHGSQSPSIFNFPQYVISGEV